MEIHFLGVGEACDGSQPNTSILIKTAANEKAGRIMLDCGFSTPHQYLSLNPPPEELDILWISHFHGDHFLGTPLLLLWFWEVGRTGSFRIAGPPGIEDTIRQAMDLAYPTLLSRLGYPLIFHEIPPGPSQQIAAASWKTAYNEHSQACLSLRLTLNEKSVFYSGDGRPTPATAILAEGCDMIIHEAYGLGDLIPGHGSINACVEFARRAGTKRLTLVHIQRDIRRKSKQAIKDQQKISSDMEILLPEKDTSLFV